MEIKILVLASLLVLCSVSQIVDFGGKKYLKVTVKQKDGTLSSTFFPAFDDKN